MPSSAFPRRLAAGLLCLPLLCAPAAARIYSVAADTRLVGEEEVYRIDAEGTTTMEYVADEYELGLSNLIQANPEVDPIVPRNGTALIIPGRLILPDTVRSGIIINSPEMRLYYYHDGQVEIFPIGIGQVGTDTPLSWVTKVERKKENPTWTPTAKMHEEYRAMGEPLPPVVPAGPDNPMGLFAIYIGRLYAIHGTNAEFGIGLRVSHGCVRLRNDDIEHLFSIVPIGTRVEFINRPLKYAALADGSLYIEVHNPLSENEAQFDSDEEVPLSFTPQDLAFFRTPGIDPDILRRALSERSGRPVLLNPPEF